MPLQPIALTDDRKWQCAITDMECFPLTFHANKYYPVKTDLPDCHYNHFSVHGWRTMKFLTFHKEQISRLGEIIESLPNKVKEFISTNDAFVFSYILGHEVEEEHQNSLKELGPNNPLFRDGWFMNSYERDKKPIRLNSDYYSANFAHKWVAKTILICYPSIISKEQASDLELSIVRPSVEINPNTIFLPCLTESNKIYFQKNQHTGMSYAWKNDKSVELGILNDNRIIHYDDDIAVLAGMLITYHRIGGYHGFFKPSIDETIPQLYAVTRFKSGKFLFYTEPFADGYIRKCMLDDNIHIGITYVFGLVSDNYL